MLRYLGKRLGITLVVVLLVMVFLAALIHVVPGDPVHAILGPRATDSLVATVRDEMRLDDPVHIQVGAFVRDALQGDLGSDFLRHVPVTRLIGSALPHTIVLGISALLIAGLIGIPLGVLSAVRPGSWFDRISRVISISFITMPPYVAGLLLLLVFAVGLGWLPAIGAGTFDQPANYFRHLVLPALALALAWVGYLARLLRASMLEVLNADYITAAHAFGLHERTIFYRLALKNAVVPTVAILGVGLGNLMGGAIFVELIFSRPGLGSLIFEAISSRNFTVLRGGVLVVAVLFIGANLLADLSYRLLDSRMRVEQGEAPL